MASFWFAFFATEREQVQRWYIKSEGGSQFIFCVSSDIG